MELIYNVIATENKRCYTTNTCLGQIDLFVNYFVSQWSEGYFAN